MPIIWNLLVNMLSKTGIFFLFLSCAIPSGIVGPGVIIGAFLGRLYGEIMVQWLGIPVNPCLLSMVGAGGVSAALARSIGLGLMIIEMTWSSTYAFPITLGVLLSYGVSNVFTMQFFEMMLAFRKLNYLPTMFPSRFYEKTVSDLVSPVNSQLKLKSSFLETLPLLVRPVLDNHEWIPVIDSNTKVLEGVIRLRYLIAYLAKVLPKQLRKIERDRTLRNYLKESLGAIVQTKGAEKDNDSSIFTIDPNFKHFLEALINYDESTPFTLEDGRVIPIKDEEFDDTADAILFLHKEIKKNKIDYRHSILEYDNSPFEVLENTNLLKTHFLFARLKLSVVWVVSKDNARLLGFVSKSTFLQERQKFSEN